MIDDGYNETGKVAGYTLVYRPLLRHQRVEIQNLLEYVLEEDFAEQAADIMWPRIIYGPDLNDKLDEEQLAQLFLLVTGFGRAEQERNDEQNLRHGTRIHLRFPHLSETSCDSCRAWFWDPITGRNAQRPPVRRPEGAPLLCEIPMPPRVSACPKGHYSKPLTFSPKNLQAYRHFRECEATGSFPDDPIVRRNAAIIREQINEFESQNHRPDGAAGGRSRAAAQQGYVGA